MWHTVDEQEPEIGKHVVWCRARHSNDEFPEFGYYYEGEWWASGRSFGEMGRDVLAWFELPPYQG